MAKVSSEKQHQYYEKWKAKQPPKVKIWDNIKVQKGEMLPDVLEITYQTGNEILKRVRCENYLTREEFAEGLDMKLSAYEKVEGGLSSVTFEMVSDVLQEYGFELIVRRKK